jgi:hypothetical protein
MIIFSFCICKFLIFLLVLGGMNGEREGKVLMSGSSDVIAESEKALEKGTRVMAQL